MDAEPEAPEARVVKACQARQWLLAAAESCTGGLLASRITDVPGASEVFLGGVVAYSNALKQAVLGVDAATFEAHGAVSAETAREMAEGARVRLQADVAVGVTGIAGPGGGTPEKPVGLVYIAVAQPAGTQVQRHVFAGSRAQVKRQSTDAALRMLLKALE